VIRGRPKKTSAQKLTPSSLVRNMPAPLAQLPSLFFVMGGHITNFEKYEVFLRKKSADIRIRRTSPSLLSALDPSTLSEDVFYGQPLIIFVEQHNQQ